MTFVDVEKYIHNGQGSSDVSLKLRILQSYTDNFVFYFPFSANFFFLVFIGLKYLLSIVYSRKNIISILVVSGIRTIFSLEIFNLKGKNRCNTAVLFLTPSSPGPRNLAQNDGGNPGEQTLKYTYIIILVAS